MAFADVAVAMSLAALFPAAIAYIANIFAPARRLALVAHGIALVAWLLLTAGLAARMIADGFPAISTSFQALLAIAAALLTLHLAQVLWKDLPGFGALVTPLAMAALFVATALPHAESSYHQEVLASQWIYLHVLSIVLSMILLLFAACCAVLWLIQHHLLKAKRWAGAFRRLPPLEVLDSMSFFLAAVGFAALTVGVVTAVVWAATHPDQQRAQNLLTRGAAILSWILYAFYLWAHGNAGWRGKKAQYILVAGCLAILITTLLHRWFFPNADVAGLGLLTIMRGAL